MKPVSARRSLNCHYYALGELFEEAEAKAKAKPRNERASGATTVTTWKVTFVDVSTELVKDICIGMPPQLRREVFIDKPELAKEVWMNMPSELAKEIWMNLVI